MFKNVEGRGESLRLPAGAVCKKLKVVIREEVDSHFPERVEGRSLERVDGRCLEKG